MDYKVINTKEQRHNKEVISNDHWEAAALDHIYPVPFNGIIGDYSGNMGIMNPAGYMS